MTELTKWDKLCADFIATWFKGIRLTYVEGAFKKIKAEGDRIQNQNKLLIKTLTDINEKVNKYGANPNLDPSNIVGDIADILNEYVHLRDGKAE